MNLPVPTPESLAGYDKLGITAVLIFVIIVGLVVIVWAVRQLRAVGRDVIAFIREITQALAEVKDALEKQHEVATRLHERTDNLMSCTRKGCPVFEMRRKQQRDAAREAAGYPVPAFPKTSASATT